MIYRGIVIKSEPFTSKKGTQLQKILVELDSGIRVMSFKSPVFAGDFPVGSVCYAELTKFPLANDVIPAAKGGD